VRQTGLFIKYPAEYFIYPKFVSQDRLVFYLLKTNRLGFLKEPPQDQILI